jgi:hypothetical protein
MLNINSNLPFDRFAALSGPELVENLVNQTFPLLGQIPTISLQVEDNVYFGYNFTLSPIKSLWLPSHASYNSLRGYWMFRPDARLCWQAVLDSGNYLRYWNADGQATGNPEDWEMFLFEAVDAQNGIVRIRQVYGKYVNLVGQTFQASGASAADAVNFKVVNE